jgi:hypothetical protein
MTLLIAIANFIVSLLRLYFVMRKGRLITIAWFLIAYFSWFFIPVVMGGEFIHIRGFTDEATRITGFDIRKTINMVFLFNIIFLISEFIFWLFMKPNKVDVSWQLPLKSGVLTRMQISFFIVLIMGTIFYGITTYAQDYRDYVEYKGSSWGMVFLWAASPLISILALRKKYIFAILACIPFIYFAIHLKVRSFALLSLIPLLAIYFLQVLTEGKANIIKKLRRLIMLAGLAVALLMLSGTIMAIKNGTSRDGFSLPDSGMPYGTVILFNLIDKYNESTGTDSLLLAIQNVANPFLKLFSYERVEIIDPPVVMAQLYDGVPRDWAVYYHYPTLWYTDAYIAFGYMGLLLPILWAFVLTVWESIMTRNTLLFGMLIPFYTWFIYMLVRGATATAVVPFSYAVYIVFIIAVIMGGFGIFKGKRYRA